jgi:hypothetical protein
VVVSTGKYDAETRRRMGIAADAQPEEVTAKVAAWFKGLYGGTKVGYVRSVKLDAKARISRSSPTSTRTSTGSRCDRSAPSGTTP